MTIGIGSPLPSFSPRASIASLSQNQEQGQQAIGKRASEKAIQYSERYPNSNFLEDLGQLRILFFVNKDAMNPWMNKLQAGLFASGFEYMSSLII
jgi:hypothetical protein